MDKKILVIEGEAIFSRFIKLSIEHEGYQVLTVENGLEGLMRAQSEVPDLIILDVMLPDMEGLEVCHHLRTAPKTVQLPILMYSTKSENIDTFTSLKAGADDYITKPWDRFDLVSKIKTMLERKSAVLSSKL